MKYENENRTTKVNDSKKVVEKFAKGKEKFEMLLDTQKSTFNKEGVGYKLDSTKKYYKNYFGKASCCPLISCNFVERMDVNTHVL